MEQTKQTLCLTKIRHFANRNRLNPSSERLLFFLLLSFFSFSSLPRLPLPLHLHLCLPPCPSPLSVCCVLVLVMHNTRYATQKRKTEKKKRTNRKTNKTRRQSSNYCFCLPGDDVRLAAPLPPSCSCGCGCGCGCDGCCCCCCCCKGTLVPVPCEWTGTLGEGSPWGGCPCMGMV